MTTLRSDRLRLRKRELFELIAYEPHPGQLLVHRSKAPRRVLACGTRWGKSTAAAVETVVFMLAPRGRTKGWLVAPTYDLTDRIFTRVADLIERHFSHRVRTLDRRSRVIVLRNLAGELAEMRAKSADKPASLLGEGLHWLVVDEAARLPRSVWDSHLAGRLVDTRGEALFLSTPRGKDWFHAQWRRGQNGRDAAYESWRSPTSANPHIAPEVIAEEQARLAPDVFAQEFDAEFVGPGADHCETCGWPNPMACSVAIFFEQEYELPTCPDCGLRCDENGKTITGCDIAGRPCFTIITGHESPEVPPAFPPGVDDDPAISSSR